MSVVLLVLGLVALMSTLLALVRVRHPSTISMFVMFTSWLTGELALFHIVLQVAVTVVLVALGALGSTTGWIGLAAMVASWLGLVRVQVVAGRARSVMGAALEPFVPGVVDSLEQRRSAQPSLWRPFKFDKTGIHLERNVSYGPDGSHRLDLYRPADPDKTESGGDRDGDSGDGSGSAGTGSGGGHPVMVYIHGGGWVSGKKEQQGLPMIHALARAGWVCVSIDYRMGPTHRFPALIDDVKLALEWVRSNIGDHGGDPSTIVVSGGSAGGHLASLAALDPDWSDQITACIPIYGAFDFTDHLEIRGYARMRPFLERMVMPMKQADDPEFWEQMSPIHIVSSEAPPFMVLYGELDVFVWREEAEAFVQKLSAVSSSPVIDIELPGTQHAFDLFNSVRSASTTDGIIAFCDAVHARQLR